MRWQALHVRERGVAVPKAAEFERVVLPHLDAAHNLARWLTKDATLADDVVQDAALRAFSYFASYKGGDARAWLLRIVRNVAYGTLSKPGRERLGSEDEAAEVADPAASAEALLSRDEDLAGLHRALAALPVELRECLVLRELEELSYKEVAQITGVPIGTVMSRLWRARQALLRCQIDGGVA